MNARADGDDRCRRLRWANRAAAADPLFRHPLWRVLCLPILAALMLAASFGFFTEPARAQDIIERPDAGRFATGISMVLDPSGYPVLVYVESESFDAGTLSVLRCLDATCSSGSVSQLAAAAAEVAETAIALDSAGRPVIAYYDVHNADLKLVRCGDLTCTSGNSTTAPDGADSVGRYPSLAIDALDRPVVAYGERTNGDLKVLRCGDATCTANNSITSPDTEGRTLGGSLVLDALGHPVVAYYDSMSNDLKVLRCGDATCTANNTIARPDSEGWVGAGATIQLDQFGFPAITYLDVTHWDLKVLRCGDRTCTTNNTITSPDTVGDVGAHASFALDDQDRAVVSYRDETNQELRLLHCGDRACLHGNTVAKPDKDPGEGYDSSMALDASGFPVVAYRTDEGELRVLSCDDANCLPDGPVPLCDGQVATMVVGAFGVATEQRDVVVGTNGDDRIVTAGGNDLICAGPGNDRVFAGLGDDIVYGGDGDDVIRASTGNDQIHGQAGNDALYGGAGSDTLLGGMGHDKLFGYGGADTLSGGNGADVIRGGWGQDTIRGGPGPDRLSGQGGNDQIDGGSGPDLAEGGPGSDFIDGGPGDDTIGGGRGDDVLYGAAGIDICAGNKGHDRADPTCETVFGLS